MFYEGIQVGSSSGSTKYPAKCFSWSWCTIYGDRVLHTNASKIKTLHRWFEADPHLEGSGDLVSRETLLQICLGLGILLNDASIVLFTEDDYPEGAPDHLKESIWDPSDYDKLLEYTVKLQDDLWNVVDASRYVNEVYV